MNISPLCHKVTYEPWTVAEGQEHFVQRLQTMGYTACSVNDTPNLRRYVVSLETVPPPSKTSYRWMYCL